MTVFGRIGVVLTFACLGPFLIFERFGSLCVFDGHLHFAFLGGSASSQLYQWQKISDDLVRAGNR